MIWTKKQDADRGSRKFPDLRPADFAAPRDATLQVQAFPAFGQRKWLSVWQKPIHLIYSSQVKNSILRDKERLWDRHIS
jgi:hypothetical protein